MMLRMDRTPFERDTAVQPGREPSTYRAEIGDRWNCPIVPHGGLVTATTVRAMIAELDRPDQPLRSVTTVFAAQVVDGPVDIDVDVLRRGRSISQVAATARHARPRRRPPHARGVRRTARRILVHRRAPARSAAPRRVPVVPRPATARMGAARVIMNFWDQIEGRPASGHPPWDDYLPTTSERSAWYRFDEPPMLDDGRLDPLAVLTMCDTMPGAVSERMGRRDQHYLPPSCDLTVHLLGDAHTEWMLAVNRARFAGEGYASTEIEIWDATLEHLVVYGTQQMFFVFPDGPPPEEERVPVS